MPMNVPDSFDVEGHRAEAVGGGVLEGPAPSPTCQRCAHAWRQASTEVIGNALRTKAMLILIGELVMFGLGLWIGGKL